MRMILKWLVIVLVLGTVSCQRKNYDPAQLSEEKANLLKQELCRYMEKLPNGISMEQRWSEKALPYYEKKANSMHLLKYYKGEDGYDYFYITRVVPSIRPGERRSSAGRFQWDGDRKIKNLEEFFLSNIMEEKPLEEAADELFEQAVEDHKITKSSSKELIEWPNDYFVYDKEEHSWDRKDFVKADTLSNR